MELRTAIALCTALASASSLAQAQTPSSATELGPTRGFSQEWGQTASYSKVSADLQTGAYDTGGGIRLGIDNSELIINSDLISEDTNEAIFKLGMGSFQAGSFTVDWAPTVGIALQDTDDVDTKNFMVGAAFTGRAQDLILNLQPAIARLDVENDNTGADYSDTVLQLGLGAYYVLPETRFGRFMPGVEFTLIEGDDYDEDILNIGVRWVYNPRVVLDLVVIHRSDYDVSGLPGIARLNVAF